MFPYLQIGPLSLPIPGLILIIGLWIGLNIAEKYSLKFGIPRNRFYDLVLLSIFIGIIFARLAYVAQYPSAFISNPLSLVSLNFNMLDIWGGIAGAGISGLVYGYRNKLNFWQVLDSLMPVILIMFFAKTFANYASGDAFGSTTDLPWGIYLWNSYRHPTQIYEAIGMLIILIIVWPTRQFINRLESGGYFLLGMALVSLLRLIEEAFRGDSTIIFSQVRLPQIISLALMIICLTLLRKRLPKPEVHTSTY